MLQKTSDICNNSAVNQDGCTNEGMGLDGILALDCFLLHRVRDCACDQCT